MAMPSPISARRLYAVVALLTHAGLIAWSATRHSPTYDEVAWLPAGLSHWEFGHFDLARVNPPLVRMVAALPVVMVPHEVDWKHYTVFPSGRPEFQVGVDFMRANGPRSLWLFTLGRWACIPFSLLGAYICYRWAAELYGPLAGCLSLTLWCFCPNVMAHAELVTSDIAAAALGAAACFGFWKWLRAPTRDHAWTCGLLLGLAQLTKTTWLLLFPLWPLLWLFCRCRSTPPHGRPTAMREAIGLGAILAIAVLVLNMGYGFEGGFKALGTYPFVSRVLTRDTGGAAPRRENCFRDTCLAGLPVPLPANYLLGIDQTKAEFEHGKRSYLRGEWRRGGWWYYYLYAMAVKLPLGTWLLLMAAIVATAAVGRFRQRWRDEIVLLAPAALVILLVSSQTGSNHHMRYVLPAFPPLFIWMGKLAARRDDTPGPRGDFRSGPAVERARRALRIAGGLALAWSVWSGLSVYPHCLSYFNAMGGGSVGGHAHLVDSNIDWGQDLLYLRAWLDQHPEARRLRLAYFGLTDPRLAGIDFELPPRLGRARAGFPDGGAQGPQPGWHAVSVNFLRGYAIPAFDGSGGLAMIAPDWFTYFLELRPIAIAGRSIYIYHLTRKDADRLRARLGLPLLGE